MKQTSLFEDAAEPPGKGLVANLGVRGSSTTLTPAQKRFNKLIARLTEQRNELARWKAFRHTYHAQLARDYEPLRAQLRHARVEMVALLDRAMDCQALGKRQRNKVRHILQALLGGLLEEGVDGELVRLYDKYADMSLEEEQQHEMAALRDIASEAFGLDVDAYEGHESPEELAEWLDERVRAAHAERRPQGPSPRKKSAKAFELEAIRKQTAAGGTRAVREVFRKLASELHPDRESDPAERARKTELMKLVNQAYKAGDLLALLELQLRIEQIDPKALAELADERLRHYVHVLEEQSRRLQEDLAEVIEPFAMALDAVTPRELTPELVRRSLEAEIYELKIAVRSLKKDVLEFQDVKALKQSLASYRVTSHDDEWDDRDVRPSRRGRRRRR